MTFTEHPTQFTAEYTSHGKVIL